LLFCPALKGEDGAEAIFNKAASALSSQHYAAAESGFQAVLKLQPRNIAALGNLGVIYSRTHRYSKSIDAYRQALKIAPGDKALLTNLGLAYVKQERYRDALPVLMPLAQDKSNRQARELLATCELSLGNNERALAILQSLAAGEPNEPGILYMSGLALSRLKRPAEAHEAYARMMNVVNPAQANFLMGKASYETQHFEEAVDYFKKSIAAGPTLEGVHRELGKALISLHDDENAAKELREAGRGDPEALYFLGGLLLQTKPSEAILLLEQAHAQMPDFWGPLFYLGRLLIDGDRAKEALPVLERAAKLKPEEASVQYQLGRALQKLGRASEAQAAFARVRALKDRSLDREIEILSQRSKP
jgi:Flp pilus assembly protein TadD